MRNEVKVHLLIILTNFAVKNALNNISYVSDCETTLVSSLFRQVNLAVFVMKL